MSAEFQEETAVGVGGEGEAGLAPGDRVSGSADRQPLPMRPPQKLDIPGQILPLPESGGGVHDDADKRKRLHLRLIAGKSQTDPTQKAPNEIFPVPHHFFFFSSFYPIH